MAEGGFIAYICLDSIDAIPENAEAILLAAAKEYTKSITALRKAMDKIANCRNSHQITPARLVWDVGNQVFRLVENLRKLSLEIDGLYDHLQRDVGPKRKWIEKAIILRRFIANRRQIPATLNWGYFEKGTKRKAQQFISN